MVHFFTCYRRCIHATVHNLRVLVTMMLTRTSLHYMLRPACQASLLPLQVGVLLRQELPKVGLEDAPQLVRARYP